jgi:hypothetical protein
MSQFYPDTPAPSATLSIEAAIEQALSFRPFSPDGPADRLDFMELENILSNRPLITEAEMRALVDAMACPPTFGQMDCIELWMGQARFNRRQQQLEHARRGLLPELETPEQNQPLQLFAGDLLLGIAEVQPTMVTG